MLTRTMIRVTRIHNVTFGTRASVLFFALAGASCAVSDRRFFCLG